ncbi:hypothetical protein OY671_008714, partial [Metschnikowia pulcherrima]
GCRARADAAGGRGRPVHRAGRRRADRAACRAGVHQHPRQPATVPVQGHDAAAHQLWRFVHHRPVARGRLPARHYPPESLSDARRGITALCPRRWRYGRALAARLCACCGAGTARPSRRARHGRSRCEDTGQARVHARACPAGGPAGQEPAYAAEGLARDSGWPRHGAAPVRKLRTVSRDRFRRLSRVSGADRRAVRRYSHGDPRTERGAGTRQPAAGEARQRYRHVLSRGRPARSQAVGQGP